MKILVNIFFKFSKYIIFVIIGILNIPLNLVMYLEISIENEN